MADVILYKYSIEERHNKWFSRILENKLDIFVVHEGDKLLSFIDVDTISYNHKIG